MDKEKERSLRNKVEREIWIAEGQTRPYPNWTHPQWLWYCLLAFLPTKLAMSLNHNSINGLMHRTTESFAPQISLFVKYPFLRIPVRMTTLTMSFWRLFQIRTITLRDITSNYRTAVYLTGHRFMLVLCLHLSWETNLKNCSMAKGHKYDFWVEITHLIILKQIVDKKWHPITMCLSLEMLRRLVYL